MWICKYGLITLQQSFLIVLFYIIILCSTFLNKFLLLIIINHNPTGIYSLVMSVLIYLKQDTHLKYFKAFLLFCYFIIAIFISAW